MAACMRCGQQLEDGAEVCSRCGGYSDQALAGLARKALATTAAGSYLRPFAPPETTPSDLPDPADERSFWAERSGSSWPGRAEDWLMSPAPGAHGPEQTSVAESGDSQLFSGLPSAIDYEGSSPPRDVSADDEPGGDLLPAPVPLAEAVTGLHEYSRAPSGRWIPIVTAALVVIIAAATVVLLIHHSAGGHAAGRKPASGRSAASSSRTTPSVVGNRVITVTPSAASSPQAPAVVSFLTRYFTAINNHDYAAYQRLFSPALRSGLSIADFENGYGSSQDSRAKLRSITPATASQIAVSVTFVSHQQVTNSQTQTGCTAWDITLYLAARGQHFVIVSPPAGYTPTFRNCS